MNRTGLILGFVVGVLFFSPYSNAQYTANFQTNIISGVTSNWNGDYVIGSNTFADVLLIQNGGALSNRIGYLGYQWPGSTNNRVVVSGVGSVWSNESSLIVGREGSVNSVVISNSGKVFSADGAVGFFGSSQNSIQIIGSGSVWSNSGDGETSIGMQGGAGNSMLIAAGGSVFSGRTRIGLFSDANNVQVTGSNSVWNIRDELIVGGYTFSRNNSLVISNGGRVVSPNSIVGLSPDGTGNSVFVTGPFSQWSSDYLAIGASGSGNSLVISNGGQVTGFVGSMGGASFFGSDNTVRVADGGVWQYLVLHVGEDGSRNSAVVAGGSILATNLAIGSGGSDNLLRMDSGSVVVTNVIGDAALEVHRGQLIVNDGMLTVDNLIVSNGGEGQLILNSGTVSAHQLMVANGSANVITFNGGQLISRGTFASNTMVFVVGNGTNTATFRLTGGTHTFVDGLWVRTNAQLVGCGLIHGSVMVDGNVSSDCAESFRFSGTVTNYGNIVTKNGAAVFFYGPLVNYGHIVATNGTVWYCSTFENHGTLLGDVQNGMNNWVNGSNGKWETAGNWSLGTPSESFPCTITNSTSKTVTIDAVTASISSSILTVVSLTLAAPSGSTNVLWLNDLGTNVALRIEDTLTIGSGGRLSINNGAVEVGGWGSGITTIDGEVFLSGASLSATNGLMLVGENGSAQITSSNSTVSAGAVYVGYSPSSLGKMAVIGPVSTWNINSELQLGYFGAGNSLVISNGASLLAGSSFVGYAESSSNNVIVVSGTGSVWSNLSSLFVGYAGSNNRLTISDGGHVVHSGYGYVGSGASSNNIVLVTGTNSEWRSDDILWLGSGPNSLIISNGGQVIDSGTYFGEGSNTVLVTGIGSVLSGDWLDVGDAGPGSKLIIADGGKAQASSFYLGDQASVLVTGDGSIWSGDDVNLAQIAYDGGGDSVVISNGGKFVSTSFVVAPPGPLILQKSISSSGGGDLGLTTNHSVLVTGAGSVWSNNGTINLGASGSGNHMAFDDGGVVISDVGLIGKSSGNSVYVGNDAVWWNHQLFVGHSGSSNSLVVDGGSVLATNLTIGRVAPFCDNVLEMNGGGVIVTNVTGDAVLEVRKGKLILNGGLLQVDRFVMTNACAQLIRTGGTLIYGTAVLDPNRDDDGDGILNGWEQSHGRDPLNAADVNADTDGDGQSDLSEFQAGTDPANNASAFRITEITPLDEDILLTWATVGGKKYAVQSVAGGGYTNNFIEFAPAFIAPGTGESEMSVIHLGGATNSAARFYRVRLVP